MSAKQDGGPIAPDMVSQMQVDANTVLESRMKAEGGMSPRDWFAGMALQGLCSATDHSNSPSVATLAKWAFQQADAMLAARKEES